MTSGIDVTILLSLSRIKQIYIYIYIYILLKLSYFTIKERVVFQKLIPFNSLDSRLFLYIC